MLLLCLCAKFPVSVTLPYHCFYYFVHHRIALLFLRIFVPLISSPFPRLVSSLVLPPIASSLFSSRLVSSPLHFPLLSSPLLSSPLHFSLLSSPLPLSTPLLPSPSYLPVIAGVWATSNASESNRRRLCIETKDERLGDGGAQDDGREKVQYDTVQYSTVQCVRTPYSIQATICRNVIAHIQMITDEKSAFVSMISMLHWSPDYNAKDFFTRDRNYHV